MPPGTLGLRQVRQRLIRVAKFDAVGRRDNSQAAGVPGVGGTTVDVGASWHVASRRDGLEADRRKLRAMLNEFGKFMRETSVLCPIGCIDTLIAADHRARIVGSRVWWDTRGSELRRRGRDMDECPVKQNASRQMSDLSNLGPRSRRTLNVQAAADQIVPKAAESRSPGSVSPASFSASEFRGLVAAHEEEERTLRRKQTADATQRRLDEIGALLQAPLSDEEWSSILDGARQLATRGETQCVIFRFPALLCSDRGRAVNLPDPEWPNTLRGKAAKVFLRWREELKPQGFRLAAQIVNFPDGLPGDVELSLVWGRYRVAPYGLIPFSRPPQ